MGKGLRLEAETGTRLGTWTDAIQQHYAARLNVQASAVSVSIQSDGIYVYCDHTRDAQYAARLSHDGVVLDDYTPVLYEIIHGE